MVWTLKTAPPEEPVVLSEIKDHLRIEHSDHDTLLESLIQASREYVEDVTSRALVEQTRIAYFRDWPLKKFGLQGSPLKSVNGIKYTNVDGITNTFSSDNYEVVIAKEPGEVVLGYSKIWPSAILLHESYPIQIEFVCGYESTSDSPPDYTKNIPESIKNAIKLDVEIRYDRPPSDYTEKIRNVIDSLIAPYRVWSF